MRNIVKKCEQFKKEVRLEQFKSRVHDPLGVKVPHYVSEIVHKIIFSGENNVNLSLSALENISSYHFTSYVTHLTTIVRCLSRYSSRFSMQRSVTQNTYMGAQNVDNKWQKA